MRREQPPDAEMRLGAPFLRDEGIGGFLDTVVDEPVGALQPLDDPATARLQEMRVDLLLRPSRCTRASVVIAALCPKHASCWNASCVSMGRRCNFPTMRSTTLSV